MRKTMMVNLILIFFTDCSNSETTDFRYEDKILGGWYYFDSNNYYNELYFSLDGHLYINTEFSWILPDKSYILENREILFKDRYDHTEGWNLLLSKLDFKSDSVEVELGSGYRTQLYRMYFHYNPFLNDFTQHELDALFMNRMENAKIVKGLLKFDSENVYEELHIDFNEE